MKKQNKFCEKTEQEKKAERAEVGILLPFPIKFLGVCKAPCNRAPQTIDFYVRLLL